MNIVRVVEQHIPDLGSDQTMVRSHYEALHVSDWSRAECEI